MRIIAGTARGVRLTVPRGKGIRPTSGRVREAILQVVGDQVVGARGLDLYAGAGGLGLEALSRGAAHMVFVDRSWPAVSFIQRSLSRLGFGDRAWVERKDVFRFLRKGASQGASFDLVFADPPYQQDVLQDLLTLLDEGRLVADSGLVVTEIAKGRVPPPQIGRFSMVWQRLYGDTHVIFWEITTKGGTS